jgi:excisionase family DNA binding protein
MENADIILEKLIFLENFIKDNIMCAKEVLTMEEASAFIGIKKTQMYKLTSGQVIPHYKSGRMCYFKRSELEVWMLRSKVKTHDELEQEAQAYCMRSKKY